MSFARRMPPPSHSRTPVQHFLYNEQNHARIRHWNSCANSHPTFGAQILLHARCRSIYRMRYNKKPRFFSCNSPLTDMMAMARWTAVAGCPCPVASSATYSNESRVETSKQVGKEKPRRICAGGYPKTVSWQQRRVRREQLELGAFRTFSGFDRSLRFGNQCQWNIIRVLRKLPASNSTLIQQRRVGLDPLPIAKHGTATRVRTADEIEGKMR